MPFSYYLIPIVTAFIGWGTNVLAVKMLFHPRKPWNFGLFTISGVIPRRQKALAGAMAEVFEEELFSIQDLIRLMEAADIEGHGGELVDAGIDRFIDRMKAKIPMAGMFLTGSLLIELKGQAKEEFIKVLPQLKDMMRSHMEEHLKIQDLIAEKIRAFSLDKLENLTMKLAKNELKTIERLGGVIGLGIGIVQVAFMLWMPQLLSLS